MNVIRNAVAFLKSARKKLRHGELSRAPLTLLRFEWRGDFFQCDWLMRPPDPWDKGLPEQTVKERQTQQAFRDALYLRELVFNAFPAVTNAELRMFRSTPSHKLELMMTGKVSRSNEVLHRMASMAMRAKLSGFQFVLSNGVLDRLIAVS